MKAETTRAISPESAVGTKMMAIAAPNVAAEAMPRVNGLARGLRSTPCITAPAIASPNPATTAKRTR
jgi:hypothetical protein